LILYFRALLNAKIAIRGILIMLFICLSFVVCYLFNCLGAKYVFSTQSTCNIGLAISAVILALLAILDDFSSYIRLVFWKSTSIKFIIVIFACDLAYISSQIKDDLNQKEVDNQKKQIANTNRKLNQSINAALKVREKNFNDSLKVRTKEITHDFVSALIENGKTYNVEQKKVIDLVRDSARRISKYSINPPEITIDTILLKSLVGDSLKVAIRFSNVKDEAKNVYIRYWIIINDGEKYFPFPAYDSNFQLLRLNSSRIIETGFTLHRLNQFRAKSIIIYFNGRFYDHDDKKYLFEYMGEVDINTKHQDLPTGVHYQKLIDAFHNYFSDTMNKKD